MSLSCTLSLSHELGHKLTQAHHKAKRRFIREALKAFKRFPVGDKVCYTCNVNRLKACDRLGTSQEIRLWKTRFFLQSRSFEDATAVIFNTRPGTELAAYTQTMELDAMYLALSETEVVNVQTGVPLTLPRPLVFASQESP